MATVALPNDQRRRLVDLIAERGGVRTALDRFNLLEDAGLRRFEARLNVDASAGDFSRQLVRVLQDHGTLEATGQPALVPLLRELRERVRGHEEDAAFLDDLLAPYQRGVATDAREAPRAGETLPAPAKRPGAPLKLFVSYRRTIWPFAERLVEDLGRHIDADIFIDISGVDEANFETALLRHLRESDVVLLVVSEHTFDADRIHRPGDWVRREIALALELGKPIVLVGVDGHLPPSPVDLPEDLRPITKMQAIPFYQEYWDPAVARLADFIAKLAPAALARAEPRPLRSSRPSQPSQPMDAAKDLPPQVAQPLVSHATLDDAIQSYEDGDFNRAIFLFRELQSGGYASKLLRVEDLLEQALRQRAAEERRREARGEYDVVVSLARRKVTLANALEAWARFRKTYPEYHEDPEGLAEELEKPVSPVNPLAEFKDQIERPKEHGQVSRSIIIASILLGLLAAWSLLGSAANMWGTIPSSPNPDQQSWLGVMLDPERSVEDRVEAGRKLAEIGDPRSGVGLRADGLPDIAWVEVPEGLFTIGSDKAAEERPVRSVGLPAFLIGKYEVTYAQYKAFLDASDGYQDERWWNEPVKLFERHVEPSKQNWTISNHPAENVSWYDAMAFCRWLTVRLREARDIEDTEEIRLPTDEEWESVARGRDGWEYPWGISYLSGYANIDEKYGGLGPYYLERTTAVGIYPQGASPFGALDMSGNVWEWTLTEFESRKSSDVSNNSARVVRGGSWNYNAPSARSAHRLRLDPGPRHSSVGFRVVRSAPIR